MKENALLFGTLFEQPSLFVRLKEELTEASRQFRQDPRAYVTAALRSNAVGGSRRRVLLQFGIALGISFYAIAFAAILVFWTVSNRVSTNRPDLARPLPDMIFPGRPNLDVQGPKDKDLAGAGGGGGNKTELPASAGQLPPPSLQDSPMAPSPEPAVKEPALPMMETVKVDPRINLRTDDLAPTGLTDGVPCAPEAGPGEGNGMGTGEKGGMGSGKGRGVGPGLGWKINGGNPAIGRTGVSSTSDDDRVDARPVALNRPRPNYTEAARKNKIQGVIRARVLVGVDGSVQNVSIVRNLPDGLNEEAITAVYQMRFKAATRNGQSVASWITLEVEFNLR